NTGGSGRTIVVAVGGAPLVGETRRWAEARCRFAAGLTVLSAGMPMFFMGEEVGAQKPYRYDDFIRHKEDIAGERSGAGRNLFAFYRDLIRLRGREPALSSRDIDVLHVHDQNRVIAFRRWHGQGRDILVIASLNDIRFDHGYTVGDERLPNGRWVEIFNSDSARYGGWGFGNGATVLASVNRALTAFLPANGFIVLGRVDASAPAETSVRDPGTRVG
ncbi:MAG TPA: alpha amylase C-terminal domain-containing protein, partial [Arenibaculum sp.]|nr:alpha amylase C-terminal domain-containing protein [Arenibaculum sp.]